MEAILRHGPSSCRRMTIPCEALAPQGQLRHQGRDPATRLQRFTASAELGSGAVRPSSGPTGRSRTDRSLGGEARLSHKYLVGTPAGSVV